MSYFSKAEIFIKRKRTFQYETVRNRLGFARFPNGSHPLVFGTIVANYSLTAILVGAAFDQLLGFSSRLGAKECHFVTHERGYSCSHQDRIALKDVDVPQASGFVHSQMRGSESHEEVAEVEIRVTLGNIFGQVLVKAGSLDAQSLHHEVVG